jgi:drug/metabolite transporter (DMT)-like permease
MRAALSLRGTEPRSSVALGCAFAVAAVLLFTLEATLAKVIGPQINAAQVTLLRGLVQIAVIVSVFRGGFPAALRTRRPFGHVGRGMLSAVGAVAYFHVFANMPLGIATVIFFSSILFTTALAGPFLAEVVGWRRWCAALVGFAGMVAVVRPGAIPFDLTLAAALFLALNAAAINLTTKDLTRTERTVTMMIWIALTTLAISIPWSLAVWTWPTWTTLWLMVGIAALGMAGQYASITAYRFADASALAPVYYTRIVISGIIGAVMFGEVFDIPTLVGSAAITASALYIAIHEGRAARRIAVSETGDAHRQR